MRDRSPVGKLSLLQTEVHDRLHEFHAWLHAEAPVHHDPETGLYIVSRYEDVRAVLTDTATFSSLNESHGLLQGGSLDRYQEILGSRGWRRVPTLQMVDPPEHGRTRRILDRIFTPRRIQAQASHIAATAHQVIDTFIDTGECDFIEAFAIPFPGRIISEQFGFDPDDVLTFRKWSRSLARSAGAVLDDAELEEAANLEIEMQQFLFGVIQQRRAEPREDLISLLVQENEADSENPLDMAEMQSVMRLVITGGYGTLTGALTNGLFSLLTTPDQMARLRADRSLLKNAIDEMLRIDTSVQGLIRTATRDTEIAGVVIPRGAQVLPRWATANHDPSKFAEPDAFKIDRPNASAHIGFDSGPHFCVGRALALLELQIGFTALLDRLDPVELAFPETGPAYQPSLIHHHLRELPIRFRKSV